MRSIMQFLGVTSLDNMKRDEMARTWIVPGTKEAQDTALPALTIQLHIETLWSQEEFIGEMMGHCNLET